MMGLKVLFATLWDFGIISAGLYVSDIYMNRRHGNNARECEEETKVLGFVRKIYIFILSYAPRHHVFINVCHDDV